MTTLRRQTKAQIDESIANGATPRVPTNGIGLTLPNGRSRRVLVDGTGKLTAAGTYYYQKVDKPAPTKFPFEQIPERQGRSLTIKLMDGTRKAVSTFDVVSKEFRPTLLGKRFYALQTVRYTVLFPVDIDLTRTNGSIFTRTGDYMPSTAVGLGEIQVSATLTPQAQEAQVRAKALDWLSRQPTISGEKILLAGYETHRLRDGPLQFNKLSFNNAAQPQAAMHVPLTASTPWSFSMDGVCSEAAEDTNGECVPHQLAKCIRLRGGTQSFTKDEITKELWNAMLELYEDSDQELLECPGFTAAAIRKVCMAFEIPFHVKHGENKLESFQPLNPRYDTLACHIWAGHLYCVTDPAARQSLARESTQVTEHRDWVLAAIQRADRKAPGLAEWELYTGLRPGNFYSRNLAATRLAMHEQNICPLVQKTGMNTLKKLIYNDCQVNAMPHEAEVCLKFLQELSRHRPHSIVYRAESFAGFGQLVFDSLCAVDPRDPPSFLEKQAVLHRSGGKCETCGDPATEIDHSVPRAAFGRDVAGNFSHKCSACHKLKTHTVDVNRLNLEDPNPYCSRMNETLYSQFVTKARRPHQVVANLHEPVRGPIWHCDVKSCRFSGICEANSHPVPIFSPLDEIEEVTSYHIADYMWVEIPPSRTRSRLRSYAYDGPRFYSKAEVQFLLEHCIARWDDMKFALHATAHRSPQDLSQKLKYMRDIWLSTGASIAGENWCGEQRGKAKEKLAKVATLSLIGAWGRVDNFRYVTIVSNHPDDCPVTGEVSTTPTPGSNCFQDTTWRSKVRSHATFLPLNLIGRAQERLQVARAIAVMLKHLRPERLISIQVDGLCFIPPRNRTEACVKELEALRYDTIHKASRKELSKYVGPLQDAIKSTATVFTLKKLSEVLLPGGALEIQPGERPELDTEEWTTHTELSEIGDSNTNFADSIVAHVLSGKSASIVGAPGTGKSYLLRSIRDALIERGDKCVVCAPTNAAARLIGGITVHAFATKMASTSHGFQGVICVDEVSMLSLALICVLDNLRLGGATIISFGDWSQLEPVSQSFRGKALSPLIFEHSALLRRWSDSTRFVLTTCRRSDQKHFDLYTNLHEDLPTAIAAVRATFPRATAMDAGLHLCISHRKRRSINSMRQEAFAIDQQTLEIPSHDGEASYQLCVGTPLVGSCTIRRIVNGAFYTVQSIVDGIFIKDSLTDEILECTVEQISKNTCLAHSVVYNRCQGCTVGDQNVILHCFASNFFRRPHLYVGLSRVANGNQIRIAP